MEIYYRIAIYILFGILPSLVWLFYYLSKDLHPEPKKMILKIFIYGILITIPTFFLQIALSQLLTQTQYFWLFTDYPLIPEILKWFFVIALTEELLKYLVVRLAVFKSKELDEPLDIMLYMVVSALGFAALENVFYLFSPIDTMSFAAILKTTLLISFIRFIGGTFLHTLCSALLGYFLVLSAYRNKGPKYAIIGVVLAVLLHGLYDFSIMTLAAPFNFIIPAIIIIGLAVFMIYDFDQVKKIKGICKIY